MIKRQYCNRLPINYPEEQQRPPPLPPIALASPTPLTLLLVASLLAQLNQGRAAMLGIFGAMIGEGIQGQTLAEHIEGGGAILIPGLL